MDKDSLRFLDNKQKFSDSLLWRLQFEAYTRFGPDAWVSKGVPSYLTSNPFIAKSYARVILGYIRDCLKKNASTPIDLEHPLYIFDLGAGTGRFAYLFLKEFLPLIKHLGFPQIKIRYIMTDIVFNNHAFCQQHPLLDDYINQGVIDFAYYYHADSTNPLKLTISQEVLNAGSLKNPLILIANYFFDTIPQDLFRIKDGRLEEGLVSLSVKKNAVTNEMSPYDPRLINDLELTYDYVPVSNPGSYYSKIPLANKILQEYLQKFDQTTFLLPIGAFESLDYLSKLSNGRIFLLAGDQGVCTDDQIRKWGEPVISRHGSFSIAVSYHALALFLRWQEGAAFLTSFPDPLFVITAGILGGKEADYPETLQAFKDNIDAFEPKDYWNLVKLMEGKEKDQPLEYLMEIVKLGNWDPMNFHAFYNSIRKQLPLATERVKKELAGMIFRVWDNFYPIVCSDGDFVLNLGVLLFELQLYKEALLLFQQSLMLTGEKSMTFMNMAACFLALDDQEAALNCFKKAKLLS